MAVGGMRTDLMLRCAFLVFMGSAAWQDIRKRSISLTTFLWGGILGLALRLWQAAGPEGGGISLSGAAFPVQSAASLASAASLVSDAASLAASLLPGILLLGISALTKEGVGRGDGWFFLVAGIYMGLGKTLLLLWGSLLLCFPISLFLLYAGRGRKKRLPFLPFVFPVGLGVVLL